MVMLLAGCSGQETALSALPLSSAKGDDGGTAAGKPTEPTDPDRPCDASSPPELQCHEEDGKDGLVCKVCLDGNGKEVARACSGGAPDKVPPPTPPPSETKCYDEASKEGVVCKVCVDANGKEVTRACSAPTPEKDPPPSPSKT